MTTSSTTGQTDFTGIVNAVQMLTQMVGQNNKTINAIAELFPELPMPSPGNALDMIRINSGGTAYEARTPAQIVTDFGLNNTAPVGASNQTTGTIINVTTPSFTAPSSGALVIICSGNGGTGPSVSLTASLAGLVVLFTVPLAVHSNAFGYLPMAATDSSTVTFSISSSTSQPLNANVMAFFLPQV